LDLAELSPDEFEFLCYLTIETTCDDAVRVANPDGGVDVGVPTPARGWKRCWQAKRFTQQVKWPECISSLDAAVLNYGMPRYTFCFARDLTIGQERLFKKHLVTRHRNVRVDYWGQSKIEGLLFATEQGQRIANAFYGDPALDARAIMRAIRAGVVESDVDVLDRLGAIAEYLEQKDALYTYVTVTREMGTSGPPLSPGTVVAVESLERGVVRRIDAVPRSRAALERPPSGTLYFEAEGAAAFEKFMAEGGELRIDGARVELENLPSAFPEVDKDSSGDAGWTVILRSERRRPPSWNARFALTTPDGATQILDIALKGSDPPEDWDGALSGAHGGLEVEMRFRSRDGLGQISVHWSYLDDAHRMTTATRRLLLAFVEGLHHGGKLLVEDRDGVRPQLEFTVPEREQASQLRVLRRYVHDVYTIEEWVGATLPVSEFVPAREVAAIHDVADIIRRGESEMTVSAISITVPRDRFDEMQTEASHRFLVEYQFGLVVQGADIPVGALTGVLDDLGIVEEGRSVDSEGQEFVSVRLEPSTDEGRHPVFKLLRGPLDLIT
jgi:hypothetical protein